eukprot:13564474-Heterocapsa_arctica.AAC.1
MSEMEAKKSYKSDELEKLTTKFGQVIIDTKAMEDEAIRSEMDEQKAYEVFVKETNSTIEAKSEDIVNKFKLKAKAENYL